jgi:bifunctional DNA-binding transcriptional regulator/antitoxin component of YhaV-PrlF toxin-antitoxin module
MATSKLTRKNQTTIPRVVIEALRLKSADRLVYEIEDGRVVLSAGTNLVDLARHPVLRKPATTRQVAEMHEAAGDAYVAHACKEVRKAARR